MDSTNKRLHEIVNDEFGGSDAEFMRVLNLARHPARFRDNIRIASTGMADGYRKVVLTGTYSYMDGAREPTCGNKPIELCVRFERGADERVRVRLDYPLHDVLYLLQ